MRQVLGQIIEYAAFLWNIPYEDFDQFFVRRENASLLELMGKKAGADWEPEVFQDEVTKNLKTGTFHLIIAVDRMNDELSQVIRYLASCSAGIRLEAVEINVYKSGEIEVLVPEIHGREIARELASSPKKTLEQVLESCPNPDIRSRLSALIEQWKSFGHSTEPGTKGISFRAQINDELHSIFWAPNPKFVSVDCTWEGISEEELTSYKEKIATIKGFDVERVMKQKSPRANFEGMDEAAVRQVAQVNHELVMILRAQNGTAN